MTLKGEALSHRGGGIPFFFTPLSFSKSYHLDGTKLDLIKHIHYALALSSSCSVDSGAHDTFSCNAVILSEVDFSLDDLYLRKNAQSECFNCKCG